MTRAGLHVTDITWEPTPASWPDEADPIERIVDLTMERDAYRALAQALLKALHDTTIERDILREQRRIDRRQQPRRAA